MSDYKPRYGTGSVDETRCAAAVHAGGRGVGFYQCQKKRKVGRYCTIHDPAYINAKRAKEEAKWAAERQATKTRRERISLLNALGTVAFEAGFTDPELLAATLAAKGGAR